LVGLGSYEMLYQIIGVNITEAHSVSEVFNEVSQTNSSIFIHALARILYFVAHLTMLGSYRLAWNLVCFPFLHFYSVIILYLFSTD
jgi:hypothetical protein